jgi:Hint domain
MAQSDGQDAFHGTNFPQGSWGSGGYDGVGFYSGGSVGVGTATLTGEVTGFGDPVSADLDGTVLTLYAYAEVADGAGIVLTSQDYSTMYIFLTSAFVPTQSYPLFYAFGDFNPPCFVAGTRIATARGEVPVEGLRVGDRVVALRSRRFAEVTWLGHRRLDCANHPRGHDVWPVRVAAGAFATDMPHRDLLLSPDHALFLDGGLVPVRYLINGATITQEKVAKVTYWHVELTSHDVLLAEGLPAESYLDTGNRGLFTNVIGPLRTHPAVARRAWKARGFASLQLDPAAHVALRRRLLARASVLGRLLTEDPDLRVLADGVPVPAMRSDFAWAVSLPAGTREVRLRSRVAVPAEILPDSADRRSLGVAVTSLALDGKPVALADPRRASGWLPPDSVMQWTAGEAVLSCEPVTSASRRLEVTLAPLLRYWLPSAPLRRVPVAA